MFIQSSDKLASLVNIQGIETINVRKASDGKFAVYAWKDDEGTMLFVSDSIHTAKEWMNRLIYLLKKQRLLIISPDKDEIPDPEIEKLRDLAEAAWGIIANAHGGDWNKESDDWRVAAEKWRDRYNADVVDKRNAERK